MATMTVRTTFALDVATEHSIQRLAKLWNTSKAEVVRRSVAKAEQEAICKSKPAPLEALKWLQTSGTRTEAEAKSWAEESRRGWEEGWKNKERTSKSPPKTRKIHPRSR